MYKLTKITMAVLVVASVIMTVGFVVTVDEKYAGATDTAETATFLYSYEGGGQENNSAGLTAIDGKTTDAAGIVYALNEEKLTATISDGKKCKGDVTIPANILVDGKSYAVKGIDKQAFARNMNIVSVHFPETNEFSIELGAFLGCKNLTSVEFPEETFFRISVMAFNMCKIKVVSIDKGELVKSSFGGNHCILVVGNELSIATTALQGIDYVVWKDATNFDPKLLKKDVTHCISAEDKKNNDKFAEYKLGQYILTGSGKYVIVSKSSYTGMKDLRVDSSGEKTYFSFEYLDYFSQSTPKVTLNGTEIQAETDGRYELTSSELAMIVDVSGAIENTYRITVEKPNNATLVFNGNYTPDENGIISAKWGSVVVFRIIPDAGYSLKNCSVTLNAVGVALYSDNSAGFVIRGDAVLSVSGLTPIEHKVVLIDGDSVTVRMVLTGSAVPGLSGKWYGMGSSIEYTNSSPVFENMVLFSVPASGQDLVEVIWSATRGSLTVSSEYIDHVSGKVPRGTEVTFAFDGGNSYEVTGWFVNGTYIASSDTSITVVADGRISVMPAVRYYESGYTYAVDSPMPFDPDNIRKVAWFGKYNDPLGGTLEDYYAMMPSRPVVVGDIMYMGVKNQLWMIDLNSDFSEGNRGTYIELEKGVGDLSYMAGKLISKNGYIFDLNLQVVAKFDKSSYFDFNIIGFYRGDLIVESTDSTFVSKFNRFHINEDSSIDTVWSYTKTNYWGKYPQIVGDVMYFILANQSAGERGFISINLDTGKVIDTVDVSPWMQGHLFDDGFINVQDGFLYLGSYTSGLFGDTLAGLIDTSPKFIRIAVDEGEFLDESIEFISIAHDSLVQHPSEFIVFRDRGYIQSGHTLYVIDMDTFSTIYTVDMPYTHGGITLTTYYASEENNWKVYIYNVPYNGHGFAVFEDCVGQTEGKVISLGELGNGQYSTRYMAASASGYLYWYNDSSVFFIYGNVENDVAFYVDGKVVINTKAVNGTKIQLPETPIREGFVFAGWYNYDGTPVTAESLVKGMMSISAVWIPAFTVTAENQTQTVLAGDTANVPDIPNGPDDRYDYEFIYWTIGGERYDFDSPVISDIVLIPYFIAHAKTINESSQTADVDANGLEEISVKVPDNLEKNLRISFGDDASVKFTDISGIKDKSLLLSIKGIPSEPSVEDTLYEISATVNGSGYIGRMEITLPYTPIDGKIPTVYWLDGGERIPMDILSYGDGSVTFVTEHNSTYVVSMEEKVGNDNPLGELIALIIIAVLATYLLVSSIHRKTKV